MPDRRTLSDPQDYPHVRMVRGYEARYWAARFNVTEVELAALIRAHGEAVASIVRAVDVRKGESATNGDADQREPWPS